MAMRLRLSAVTVVAAVGLLLVVPASASAETVIPSGHAVTEITVIGQDVTLNGTSQGSVIIVDGDLTIGPHGRALHGITLVGGHLSAAPGAQVRGDVLQVGGSIPHPGGWTIAAILAGLLLSRCAIVWLVLRIGGALAQWQTTTTMLAAARVRPLRASLVGALLAAGVLAGVILLTLTVVGIVFAAALLGGLVLAAALGVAFALTATQGRRDQDSTVAFAVAFPIVGDALLALAVIVALGALFHYLIDERRAQTTPVAATP
jgi:hypothetical protein